MRGFSDSTARLVWRSAIAVGAFACIALAQGCGPVPVPDFAPAGNADVDAATAAKLFEEDGDPAVAMLPFVEDELLVQPFPGADGRSLAEQIRQAGAVVIDELPEIDLIVLRVPVGDMNRLAAELSRGGLVESFQKNYIFTPEGMTPNDPQFVSQTWLSQVGVDEAWNLTTGDERIIIGVVDTGVDGTHADLKTKIIDGWNTYDNNATYADVMGHGTEVAGVAAAISDNTLGVSGVAWDCPIIAVRATDSSGNGTARHIAAGILWAAGRGAKVINASFAPLWSNRVVKAAAQSAFNRGSLVVISAGNAGGTATSGGYDEAVFVGAVTDQNEIAYFSDRGPFVDLTAPGVEILTTQRGGGYGVASGTSFAAPIVSGVAALAWSTNPDLRPVSIVSALTSTAMDRGTPGSDIEYGTGVVQAAQAVAKAAATREVADVTPPTARVTSPATGGSLSGVGNVVVDAKDAGGVADVTLSVDGRPFATDTRSPYKFALDTASFSVGSHRLTIVATDLFGNASPPVSLDVSFRAGSTSASASATQITFRAPKPGATVSGNVTIDATVSDPDGLATVEWFIDGESVFASAVSGTSSGVTYLWRGTGSSSGAHLISVVITDGTGAQTTGTLRVTRR